MRAILLTGMAAVIVATPALGDRAGATTFGGTSAPRAARTDTALPRQAAVVCGYNGRGRVHTAGVRPHQPRP